MTKHSWQRNPPKGSFPIVHEDDSLLPSFHHRQHYRRMQKRNYDPRLTMATRIKRTCINDPVNRATKNIGIPILSLRSLTIASSSWSSESSLTSTCSSNVHGLTSSHVTRSASFLFSFLRNPEENTMVDDTMSLMDFMDEWDDLDKYLD
jgi:hypothetical protein